MNLQKKGQIKKIKKVGLLDSDLYTYLTFDVDWFSELHSTLGCQEGRKLFWILSIHVHLSPYKAGAK